MRHLGNDEIHIVWSENQRSFRRGIINTEFGDLTIIIYPMKSSLYKIKMLKRSYITITGPLYDGALVPFQNLAHLIIQTCLSTSSMIKKSNSLFKNMYLLFFYLFFLVMKIVKNILKA